MKAGPAQLDRARAIDAALAAAYPEAGCALEHRTPYQLLVATILSAQCTDARVNLVTPVLFARFPDVVSLAGAKPGEVEDIIRSTGFFRAKTRSLLGMARAVTERHGGRIPDDMEALTQLPGVGRKTANVLLGTAFGRATGVVVDTHVARLSRRMGLSRHQDPVRIERDLMAQFPPESWIVLSHRLIQHGRSLCPARRPRCLDCFLAPICPKVGVPAQPADSNRRPAKET